ncbi:thiamine pyrophosphate-binding protein [Streptomyces angustmyceticus]|uniref:thiamine pyrophosphate-binding protein n=1 Tax=Streptomyces angustmyceticus TaxID=285578 RepID=UPI003802A16D
MAAQRIPAVRAAVQVLADEGVEIVFGCPGAALLPLCTAMTEAGGIERLPARHPEGALHMAHGWARTCGRPGVAAAAAGPGAARLLAGLYAARQEAVPLVCLTGQEAAGERPATGPLHASGPPDLIRLAGPVTKRAERIEDPARIPGAFREAFRIAREGRPGPVLIDLPADLAAAEIAAWSGVGSGRAVRAPQTAAGGREVPPPAPTDRTGPEGPGTPAPWPLTEIAEIFAADGAPDTHLVGGAAGSWSLAATRKGPGGGRWHHHPGTPGWEVPAAIGVRRALDLRGERDAEVVVAVDGEESPFLAEELASAVRHEVPFVLLLHRPGHDGRGRRRDPCAPDEYLTDHVKLVEAYGCAGRDVVEPAELRSAVEWARKEAVSTRRPVLVDVRTGPAGRPPGDAVSSPLHQHHHDPENTP